MLKVHDFFFRRYLSEGDTIRAIFHRHFFVALPNIFFWLAVPVSLVSWWVYKWWYPGILTSPFLWLFEAYLFLLFFIMLYKVLDWYSDVWIMTDRGMIDVRWSLFMNDFTFTEYDDVSAVQSHQGSIFDKMFNIGDITIHKMGDEMYISRMYKPREIVDIIQSNLREHHHDDHSEGKDMHIYVDGVRQNHVAVPYKTGFRYVPTEMDDVKYIESIRKQPGTIDLSAAPKKVEEKKHGHISHGHGHHGH